MSQNGRLRTNQSSGSGRSSNKVIHSPKFTRSSQQQNQRMETSFNTSGNLENSLNLPNPPTETESITLESIANSIALLTKEVKESNRKIKKTHDIVEKLTEDVVALKKRVDQNDEKFVQVEDKVSNVESHLQNLHSANLAMQLKLNELNLILFGLPEESDETEFSLIEKLTECLAPLSEQKIVPETAKRLGLIKPDSPRPIKMRFSTLTQRNIVFDRQSSLSNDKLTIKKDVPFELRRDYAILMKKKQDAINDGVAEEDIAIDFRAKRMKIGSDEIQIQSIMTNSQPKNSSRGPFLGNGNQRKRSYNQVRLQ